MEKPKKLLDLYCGAGGAAMGYHRAGLEVTGIDVDRQPRYPFEFIRADALEYVAKHGHEYDVIHASPPCQAFTCMSNRWRGKGGKTDSHWNEIDAVRFYLVGTGRPYIIENVPGAKDLLQDPITLNGGMFGLGVTRPRLFESNLRLRPPRTRGRVKNPIGVYGNLDGRLLYKRKDGTEQRAASSLAQAQEAMGIDWMIWGELKEAIPPAYTHHIGEQLL